MIKTPQKSAFKKKVSLEALREDKTTSQFANQHSAHPIQVGQWKKTLMNEDESLLVE